MHLYENLIVEINLTNDHVYLSILPITTVSGVNETIEHDITDVYVQHLNF